MQMDHEASYQALAGRDRRFDGVFITAVHTTGIYCRPSCPARTPKSSNVSFYPSAAAAQLSGFRACRRCLPDATPGSPEWDVVADAGRRAMRLIADGVVDRDGVDGLAAAMGYSVRQLNRILKESFGAGALALARSQRAQTARLLMEASTLPFADIAFAAGFSSIRQFNDTIREVYAATPTQLRGAAGGSREATDSTVKLGVRIPVREPFASAEVLGFLARHQVSEIEAVEDSKFNRAVRLPHGVGRLSIELGKASDGQVPAHIELTDIRDLAAALERARRLLDANADPVAVDAFLSANGFAREVRACPGIRVPGHVDPEEMAVLAVIGQQVSISAARTKADQLVTAYGEDSSLGRLFPSAETLAAIDPEELKMPRARATTLVNLCAALAAGEINVDRSMDRAEAKAALQSLKGIGPWTANYIAMRALGDPDVDLAGDLVARRELDKRGTQLDQLSPWRSYALMHSWRAAIANHNGEAA